MYRDSRSVNDRAEQKEPAGSSEESAVYHEGQIDGSIRLVLVGAWRGAYMHGKNELVPVTTPAAEIATMARVITEPLENALSRPIAFPLANETSGRALLNAFCA